MKLDHNSYLKEKNKIKKNLHQNIHWTTQFYQNKCIHTIIVDHHFHTQNFMSFNIFYKQFDFLLNVYYINLNKVYIFYEIKRNKK